MAPHCIRACGLATYRDRGSRGAACVNGMAAAPRGAVVEGRVATRLSKGRKAAVLRTLITWL